MMQLGMIGLGRMGGNMVTRLQRGGHTCVVSDLDAKAVQAATAQGAVGTSSLADLVQKLERPRSVWVMVPAGAITDKVVTQLGEQLESGDAIIDGGNSHFKDDIRRARTLAERGIDYLDVGTSGGVWGLERGYCLMIGGVRAAFDRLEPIFATLAPGIGDVPRTPGRTGEPGASEQGYLYCGPTGAGHFVKMIHNGIEYGIMQAYAEGFDILAGAASPELPPERRLQLDVREIAEVWRRGSVVGSWLLDLTAQRSSRIPSSRATRATWRIRARVAGPSTPRSSRPLRSTCSPRPCSRASDRARTRRSPTRCSPRCARSSAAIRNRSEPMKEAAP
jgi:6-phosphogluconate dehydrogenase